MMKEITICVLTYNRADQLSVTIKNLVDQFGEKTNILILNNGSSDGTEEVLRELSNKFDGLEVFNSNSNLGVSGGRAFLWGKASTHYILSIDDDIIVSFDALSSMMSKFAVNENVGLVSPNIQDSESGVVVNPIQLRGLPTFYEACFLVKRDVVEAVGVFDSRLMYAGEGLDYALRLRNSGFEVSRDIGATVVHFDRVRSEVDLSLRRAQWLWSFCFVYWKNLPINQAVFWSVRNLSAHVKTGFPALGIVFVLRLPKHFFSGVMAGFKARRMVSRYEQK